MSRVVIIGGSGHVGTYLVPRLVAAGHEITNISRSQRQPYQPHSAWSSVETLTVDREAEEQAGTFGAIVRDLRPDIVVDMICFTLSSAQHLVDALKGQVTHFLHTGTIWVHGPSVTVPTPEDAPRRPFGEYGTQKAAIEAFLMEEARKNHFPATVLHPGHIVGPGWAPLNPEGHFDVDVFSRLATGGEILIPNFGLETVHHVHADDVARLFMAAIGQWGASVGEAFHAVSPGAVSLKGYAETMAAYFGRELNARFLPFDEWKTHRSESDATKTWEHIVRSPSCSMAKAEQRLNYRPRFTSFEGVFEAVDWLVADGQIKTN